MLFKSSRGNGIIVSIFHSASTLSVASSWYRLGMRTIVELASYSAVSLATRDEYSHQAATWPWALWNGVMVKGGISMDTPTLTCIREVA